jgi:Domain of unknown function DUF11/Right handed beta helix region
MVRPRLLFSLLLFVFAPLALADADLAVDISVVGTPYIDRTVEFLVEITNRGPDTAVAVVLNWNAEGEPPLQTNEGRCTQAGNALRCELTGLEAGRSFRLRATKHLHPFNDYHLVNVSAATADPNPENNEDFIYVRPLNPRGEVRAEIQMPTEFGPDNTLTFRYDIRNQGLEYPAELKARISISHATELVSSNGNCRSIGSPGLLVECDLGTVPPATTVPLEITARFPEPTGRIQTQLNVIWIGYGDEAIYTTQGQGIYPRRYVVTSSADAGPGSLRATLIDANARCTGEVQCQIHFAINEPVPPEGWFTIRPLTPLPDIIAKRVTIDAGTQAAATGDTNKLGPEVLLDGSALTVGHGLLLREAGSLGISGFAISNFPGNGIMAVTTDPNLLGFAFTSNYIGVDPTGTRAMPNERGIDVTGGYGNLTKNVIAGNRRSAIFVWEARTLQVWENRIGVAAHSDDPIPNGATGVFVATSNQGQFSTVGIFRNVIANNGHFGIAYTDDVWASVGPNRIWGNGLSAIDIDLDGPSDRVVATPRITRAYWDGVGTVIEGTTPEWETGSITRRYSVLLFANSELEPGGFAEGEVHFGTVDTDQFGRFTLRYSGDLRGKYVNGLTVLRTNFFGEFEASRTSELGQAILVTEQP